MLGNLMRRWFGKPAGMRKPAQGLFGRATLRVETLEDRCLMTASIAEYPVTSGSAPFAVTTGPDGNEWFTEKSANQIGMINPTTHAVTEFAIPTASSAPTGITAGPDGNIWFTESAANQIGMLNISTHVVTEFPITGSDPTAIVSGPDGNLWFTETGSNKIGVINPTTDAVTQYTVPTGSSSPTGITVGSDGNLWFTENATNKIASINPSTHTFAEFVVPQASSQPYGITSGSDNNIWFTESNANRIGEFNITTHVISSFAITGTGEPKGIASGSDGNLWFTETGTDQVGTLALPGDTISLINIPTAASGPAGIGIGPGGTLWYAESSASQIGEIVAPTTITTAPVSQTIVAGQTATFTASAVGFPTPTVQWEFSTNDGITFTPVINGGIYSITTATATNGITTDTLTITDAPTTMTGYQYEAIFTNGISPTPTVTTAPVTLTVNNVLSLSTPAQGVINTPYSQTISVLGSTSVFTLFAVNNFNAGGTGLTLSDITTNTINGTLTITGTPTGTGTASFTIAVANAAGNSLTQNVSVTINPPLSIATTTLPQATAGTAYNQSINVIGGVMPYTVFSVTNFNPGTTGLTPGSITANSAAGVFAINAIPSAAGTVTFTVNISDSAGTLATKNYTIIVNPALAITPSLPQGTAGTNYDQTLTVTGGYVPYTTLTVTSFNVGTTGLSPGSITTNLAAGTITINGTPLAAGTITFVANVTDSIGAVLTQSYTVKINPALTITPTLPQGTAASAYHQTITVTGGTTPYTTFNVTGFSAGSTGLTSAAVTVNAATNTIVISGTPTAAGTLAFTVNVTDSAGGSLTKAYSITINPPLTVSNLSTTQWSAGAAGFTGTMSVGGGTTPVTIASATGLPTGLSLTVVGGNTLAFTGTPSAAGVFSNGSVTLHDAAGASITKTFSITINAAPTISALSATAWTTGRTGFNGVMTAAGGTGGLSIASATGVPTGLSIVLNGNTLSFTGTPTAVGTFAGSVTLKDGIGAKVTRTFSITINAAPSIGNLTTTAWTAGKAGFTGTLAIVAGTTPHLITAQSGLPTGLTAVVVGTNIQFTGTPSAAGSFNCSITIQDAAGASVTKTFSITINPPVLIVTPSVPACTMGVLYKTTLLTTGGTGAVTFKVSSGSLPPGYTLNSNGTITGLSRGIGSFTFTVTATDAVGATVTKTYTLVVGR